MAPSELVTSDPARRHRLIADDFARRVHGTRDWSAAAPVSGWAARDVVIHLVEWLPGFVASGSDIRLPEVPSPAEQPGPAWDAHQRAVQDLLDDPATAGVEFANPHIGSMPLAQAIDRFYTSDVFMHTWDLATGHVPGRHARPGAVRRAALRHGADRGPHAELRPVRATGSGARDRRSADRA